MTTQDNKTAKMIKVFLFLTMIVITDFVGNTLLAQQKTDTLIVTVGASKIMFLINNKEDLEKMKNHDLNAILDQLSLKLNQDSSALLNSKDAMVNDTTIVVADEQTNNVDNSDNWINDDDQGDDDDNNYRRRYRGTRSFFNIDLGTNNYLSDGKFPSGDNKPEAVRPWGSWYIALASVNQTNFTRSLYFEWGISVSWYNFKFEDDNTRVIDGDVVQFIKDTNPDIDYTKSKLTASYINASLVPMLRLGSRKSKGIKISWSSGKGTRHVRNRSVDKGSFRIGAGPYVGYRLGSHTKIKFKEGGDRERDKQRDSFNLNNFRYGLRAQLGFRGTDLFVNYDMNELFQEGKGPKLNAFSFGIIL